MMMLSELAGSSQREGKLFFGGLYSTVTRLSISLTTTGTRYLTCISAIDNIPSCSGRRRKRNIIQRFSPE